MLIQATTVLAQASGLGDDELEHRIRQDTAGALTALGVLSLGPQAHHPRAALA